MRPRTELAPRMHELFRQLTGDEPTPSQNQAIRYLSALLDTRQPRPTMVLKGYAGTGKTSLMRSFCQLCDEEDVATVLMAPTGRAAKVLTGFTGRPARTIHRLIYRYGPDGATLDVSSGYKPATVFVVDEASMIGDAVSDGGIFGSHNLLDDLMEYVFAQPEARLLLIGDPAQLPPIGVNNSPALEPGLAERYGLTRGEVELTDVVRQAANSDMLLNANRLRKMIAEGGPFRGLPPLQCGDGYNTHSDVETVTQEELCERLQQAYAEYGFDETIVLVQANWQANENNFFIKNMVLEQQSHLSVGDRLLVTRNNYHWLRGKRQGAFLANGDIVEVLDVKEYEVHYGCQFARVWLRMVSDETLEFEAVVLVEMLLPAAAGRKHRKVEEFRSQIEQGLAADVAAGKRVDEGVVNALEVRHAYVITAHKAQGGQWKAVFVNMQFSIKDSRDNPLRWYYTALTRATEKLYLVKYDADLMTALGAGEERRERW